MSDKDIIDACRKCMVDGRYTRQDDVITMLNGAIVSPSPNGFKGSREFYEGLHDLCKVCPKYIEGSPRVANYMVSNLSE